MHGLGRRSGCVATLGSIRVRGRRRFFRCCHTCLNGGSSVFPRCCLRGPWKSCSSRMKSTTHCAPRSAGRVPERFSRFCRSAVVLSLSFSPCDPSPPTTHASTTGMIVAERAARRAAEMSGPFGRRESKRT
ncbi:hypothetical protein C7S16_0896 [Burkholderia thailandensis]|uniref:Uncharacterized protein n=1 Tax=Burkholderia thailandensis TaxID=57975 RepID=A0AAW9D594_BURTH|nr:hypothetical protein [Burkholderia thailandensis]MDW9256942.1 hypothetical protein [Burkholderia thailandensis]